MKKVKAPAGYHWMKKGTGYKLMKHTGKFVKNTGASLYASFPKIGRASCRERV